MDWLILVIGLLNLFSYIIKSIYIVFYKYYGFKFYRDFIRDFLFYCWEGEGKEGL